MVSITTFDTLSSCLKITTDDIRYWCSITIHAPQYQDPRQESLPCYDSKWHLLGTVSLIVSWLWCRDEVYRVSHTLWSHSVKCFYLRWHDSDSSNIMNGLLYTDLALISQASKKLLTVLLCLQLKWAAVQHWYGHCSSAVATLPYYEFYSLSDGSDIKPV